MRLKKLLLPLLVCPLLLTACSSDEPALKENRPAQLNKRTESEMIEYAVSAYTKLNGVQSRAGVNYGKLNKIGAVNGSRSGEDDYSLYSLDFGEDEGYVIVTDCDRVPPVFAVVETGCFEDNDENSPVNYYLDLARNYIKEQTSGLAGGIEPSNPGYQYWEEVTDTIGYWVVPPQLDVWWGQSGGYNKYCDINPETGENYVTGCGPTAMSMLLSFLNYPSINITFGGRHEVLMPNWGEINIHKYRRPNCYDKGIVLSFCHASDESHDNIAKIMRQMGVICNSEYKNIGTATTPIGILSGLSTLKINHKGLKSYIGETLKNGEILIMFGGEEDNAHIFLADGLNYLHYRVILNIYEILNIEDKDGNKVKKLISSTVIKDSLTDMVHLVWGFDNAGVGYFYESVFNPTQPKSLDTGAVPSTTNELLNPTKYICVSKNDN